jgi:8-oxo-dGTP pyrophosphatase MutT (NUDIX family)
MTEVTEDTRHFTASMVVIDPQTARILMVLHKATGQWLFPGGHIDLDEAPHEAAIREVREETGITPDLVATAQIRRGPSTAHPIPFDVQEFPAPVKPHKGEPAHHHIDFLYVGYSDSRVELLPQEDEVDAVRWVTLFDIVAGGLPFRDEVPEVAAEALRMWG